MAQFRTLCAILAASALSVGASADTGNDVKNPVEIHPAVAPVIRMIEAQRQQPDFPLEELVPEVYTEGRNRKTKWVAKPSPYNYICAGEMNFKRYHVTYCLAKDDSGTQILAVRMKFPPRIEDGRSISSIVQSSGIEVVSYNKGPFEKGKGIVDKQDNVKITMKGAYGAPDVTYFSGFGDGKPMQSWYIHTCSNFTDKRNQEHDDNPWLVPRKIIGLFWEKYARFYADIFPKDGDSNQKLADSLSKIDSAARDRFVTRLEDDSREGLYKVALARQSEVCPP